MAMDINIIYKNDTKEIESFIAVCYDGCVRLFEGSSSLADLKITQCVKVGSFPLMKLAVKDHQHVVIVGDSTNYYV